MGLRTHSGHEHRDAGPYHRTRHPRPFRRTLRLGPRRRACRQFRTSALRWCFWRSDWPSPCPASSGSSSNRSRRWSTCGRTLPQSSTRQAGSSLTSGCWAPLDFGVLSRRRRAFLIAHKTKPVHIPQPVPGTARTSAAAALGWGPGEQVRTRANRKPGGGNLFSTENPAWCLTEKARTWTRESDGARLTSSQAGCSTVSRRGFHGPAAGPGSSCRPPTSWPRRSPRRCWQRSQPDPY